MELIKHEMAQGKLKQTTLPPICYFAEDLPMLPGEAGTRLLQTVRVGEKVQVIIWASTRENLPSEVCEQQKGRPACPFAQSDQRLCYSLFEKYHI